MWKSFEKAGKLALVNEILVALSLLVKSIAIGVLQIPTMLCLQFYIKNALTSVASAIFY